MRENLSRLNIVVIPMIVLAAIVTAITMTLQQPLGLVTYIGVALLGIAMLGIVLIVLNHGWLREEIRRLELRLNDAAREAVANAQRIAELELIDPATTLLSQRYFMQRLMEETSRANRYNYPIALAFLDVVIRENQLEREGRPCEESELRQAADYVKSMLNSTDMIARYSGGGIAILLPYSSLKNAEYQASRVRAALNEYAITNDKGEKLRFSCRIGISAFPDPSPSMSSLITDAIDAMTHTVNNAA